jgi:DNA-binding CsgD family transcriptional regulator
MKKVTYALYKRVRRQAENGLDSSEIAKANGLSEFQVLEIITTKYTKLSDESEIDKELRLILTEASDAIVETQTKPKTEILSPRNLRIIELRKKGKTLDEIGKEVNITRERVRQILKKYAADLDFEEIRNEQRVEQDGKFKEDNEEIFRLISLNWEKYQYLKFQDLSQILSVPEWRIRRCISRIQYVYLHANEERKIAQFWTDEQCLKSLQNAATYAFPLTVTKYRRLLDSGEVQGPTPPLYWQRFGSWVQACELAGVEYGEAVREYNRTWNDTELITFARRFMHSREDGKWSLEKYEEWRRLPNIEGPSMALLRLRLGSWSEIRVLALELKSEEFDMHKFSELRSDE